MTTPAEIIRQAREFIADRWVKGHFYVDDHGEMYAEGDFSPRVVTKACAIGTMRHIAAELLGCDTMEVKDHPQYIQAMTALSKALDAKWKSDGEFDAVLDYVISGDDPIEELEAFVIRFNDANDTQLNDVTALFFRAERNAPLA